MTVHLLTTRAGRRSCVRCRQSILFGYSEGVPVYVDRAPIDRAAELAALVEGRWTYLLLRTGELLHRDEYRVRRALIDGETVHRAHQCPPETAPADIRAAHSIARDFGLANRLGARIRRTSDGQTTISRKGSSS